MQKAAKYILYSQLVLLVSILLCVKLVPKIVFTHNQGGLSNYGTIQTTLGVFSLGIWTCVFLLLKVSQLLKAGSLRLSIRLLAAGYVLLVLSTYPYKLNAVFENLHIIISIGFAAFQQGMAIWLAKLNRYDTFSMFCLAVLLVGFSVGLLTAFETVHLLFTAQVIGGISFGALLVYSVRKQ